jgi:AraC-like DNA-binding protein
MSLGAAFRVLVSELESVGLDPAAVCAEVAVDPRAPLRDVVDDVRRTLAERLVAERTLHLADVATRTGFADAAALGNAFRRWFGESPSAFRRR